MTAILTSATASTFDAYNDGGPPERAGLTHDGKPVPPFDRLGASVSHKWHAATAHAVRIGADAVIDLVRAGHTDPDELRAMIERAFDCPAFVPPTPDPAP
jgi:hypothetical protein